MKNNLLLVLLLGASTAVFSQKIVDKKLTGNSGFGYLESSKTECINAEQRATIQVQLRRSIDSLIALGKLTRITRTPDNAPLIIAMNWPLRKKTGITDPDNHGISNFVDRDPAFPDHILDYECGTRSYDLASGYNHQGTDFFTWPYGFYKMDNNEVEIVAAEAGTIIFKSDGNFDKNCGFSGTWNAVYVQHADGSVAWYGHMKSGSLTSKTVAMTVAKGEYLGQVGSSGNSTAPHLHLELYDASSTLVDPWNGACNSSPSWWASQRPYYDSKVNKLSTHLIHPVFPACPATETPNETSSFTRGQTVILYTFLHDETDGKSHVHTILKPDGSTYGSWMITFSLPHYEASYWWNTITLLSTAPLGTWKHQVVYEGVTTEIAFEVSRIVPVELADFRAKLTADKRAALIWETKSEINNAYFNVQKSADGANWKTFTKTKATGGTTATPQYYSVFDDHLTEGMNYYRLEQVDLDGTTEFSKVVSVVWHRQPFKVRMYPNPVGDGYLTIDFESLEPSANGTWSVELIDATGRIVERKNAVFETMHKVLIRTESLPSGVYMVRMSNGQGQFLQKIIK